MCTKFLIRHFDNRCHHISDWSFPFEYQCKQLNAFLGVNSAVGFVPLALVPWFLVVSFPHCSAGRVPVNIMVENRSSWQLFFGHVTVLLRSLHFHGLFIWGPFGLTPAFLSHLVSHCPPSYELGYHLTRVFIYFQWVTSYSLTKPTLFLIVGMLLSTFLPI